jgi:hypothetical protein
LKAILLTLLAVIGLVALAASVLLRRVPIPYQVLDAEPKYEVLSPDGRYVARYYIVKGPPWRVADRIGVQRVDDAFNPARYLTEFFSPLEPCLSWVDDSVLKVHFPTGSYVLDNRDAIRVAGRKIRITYGEWAAETDGFTWQYADVDEHWACPTRPEP